MISYRFVLPLAKRHNDRASAAGRQLRSRQVVDERHADSGPLQALVMRNQKLTLLWRIELPSLLVTCTAQQLNISKRFRSSIPLAPFFFQHIIARRAPGIGTRISWIIGPPKSERLGNAKTLGNVSANEGLLLVAMDFTMDCTLVITHLHSA
jgi:hypothetical protein